MKPAKVALIAATASAGAVAGAFAGATIALSRAEASAAAWHWLDASSVLAASDGAPKSAEQQRDALNGNFIAQTRTLSALLPDVPDRELQARVLQRARQLASHPDAIAETPLGFDQKPVANAVIACLAAAKDAEAARTCGTTAAKPARQSGT